MYVIKHIYVSVQIQPLPLPSVVVVDTWNRVVFDAHSCLMPDLSEDQVLPQPTMFHACVPLALVIETKRHASFVQH